ncbi:helix-turn-helix transcriptional regulator [Klenkia marina]|uniref:helix-turn-helix transcriptional regulator n=1 Tax=Klenkia marina TaxID=1960309 RepID=UPI000B80E1BA|nr:YafY family protein [Klenkia marina]
MAKPTARVLALLETLQSGGRWTVADLAGRLGVDERTVRRYVQHLLELDVPVRSVRGRFGGYQLAPGFRLPPLMFTDDEAVAVLLGLVAARRLIPSVVPDEGSASAVAKIRRVLPEALGRRITALLQAARFTAPDHDADGAEARTLLVLADAAAARRPVVVDYTDRHGTRTERTLHPYGLVVHSGRWYVVAADASDDGMRNFRLDRISAPSPRPGTFAVPAGFDAVEHVTAGLAAAPWRHEVEVVVEGVVDDVVQRLPAGLADVREEPGRPGWVRLQLRAERLDWVPALLVGLQRPFEVAAPEELRREVAAVGRLLISAAGEGETSSGTSAGVLRS